MLRKPRPGAEERDTGGHLPIPFVAACDAAITGQNFTAAGLLADGAGARSGIRAPGSYFQVRNMVDLPSVPEFHTQKFTAIIWRRGCIEDASGDFIQLP